MENCTSQELSPHVNTSVAGQPFAENSREPLQGSGYCIHGRIYFLKQYQCISSSIFPLHFWPFIPCPLFREGKVTESQGNDHLEDKESNLDMSKVLRDCDEVFPDPWTRKILWTVGGGEMMGAEILVGSLRNKDQLKM